MTVLAESIKNCINQLEKPGPKRRFKVKWIKVGATLTIVTVAVSAAAWVAHNPKRVVNAGKTIIQKGERFLDSTLGRAIDHEYDRLERQIPGHQNPDESPSKGK